MDEYDYERLPLELLPKEIIEEHNLLELTSNGKTYFEVQNEKPSLK